MLVGMWCSGLMAKACFSVTFVTSDGSVSPLPGDAIRSGDFESDAGLGDT